MSDAERLAAQSARGQRIAANRSPPQRLVVFRRQLQAHLHIPARDAGVPGGYSVATTR